MEEEGSEEVVEGKAEIVCFLGKWSGSLTFSWAGPDQSWSGLSCRPKIGLASICSSLVYRISFLRNKKRLFQSIDKATARNGALVGYFEEKLKVMVLEREGKEK
jgi:hypothetical protein